MGLVVANGYGRDPNDCCDRGATVHLRFTSERGSAHPICDSLCLSLPLSVDPSLPLHPSPNGSQAATRCCVGSSKRASERSKQFSLMPSPLRSVPPSSARPPSAYEDCLCLLPIVVSQPAESFEQVPQASKLPAAAAAFYGGGGQDPEIRSGRCLPFLAAPGRPPARPARVFGRPSPSSSLRFGSWLRRRSLSA